MPDRYGRTWPDVTPAELCAECGQPDNCGDCTHGRLSAQQVLDLGGICSLVAVRTADGVVGTMPEWLAEAYIDAGQGTLA